MDQSPTKALEFLYLTTRRVGTGADDHDQYMAAYKTVLAELLKAKPEAPPKGPKEPKGRKCESK